MSRKEHSHYIEHRVKGAHPIKMWTKGVPVDDKAKKQLEQTASLPIIYSHIAVMPDVHYGLGSTVGSVIPTKKAIIPAAVGVDLGCGMMAVQTSLTAKDLPDNLAPLRIEWERVIPHGRTVGRKIKRDKGSWEKTPERVDRYWAELLPSFKKITDKYPRFLKSNHHKHLGTLGTGNHFVELCLDLNDRVWIMLHSGSRGVGNAIGTFFIEKAKEEMLRLDRTLPDKNLAYLDEGSRYFDDYLEAVEWAQNYARKNREVMMEHAIKALRKIVPKPFTLTESAINCHHNYVEEEEHFGESLYITRKGAVSARRGELGIIPGSMGAKSFIVRGLGNEASFCSCSHGAGRVMSRTEAKRRVSLEEHLKATEGVECRKDADVIDETPSAYKDIEAVMAAQSDLVEVVHELKQIVCVKG